MEPVPFLKTKIVHHTPCRPIGNGAFTLIEMLVVLAIVTVITGIVLSSQSTFNRTLLLTDTAYTVALSARQTQSLGLSSRQYGATHNAGYGIHVDSTSNTSYVQFADVANAPKSIPGWCSTGTAGTPDAKPGNCQYDGASEQVQRYAFSQGYTLSNFCAYYNNLLIGCKSTGVITAIDVLFQRPNTNSVMSATLASTAVTQADTVCLEIASPDGTAHKYVRITQLGEISAQSSCP